MGRLTFTVTEARPVSWPSVPATVSVWVPRASEEAAIVRVCPAPSRAPSTYQLTSASGSDAGWLFMSALVALSVTSSEHSRQSRISEPALMIVWPGTGAVMVIAGGVLYVDTG